MNGLCAGGARSPAGGLRHSWQAAMAGLICPDVRLPYVQDFYSEAGNRPGLYGAVAGMLGSLVAADGQRGWTTTAAWSRQGPGIGPRRDQRGGGRHHAHQRPAQHSAAAGTSRRGGGLRRSDGGVAVLGGGRERRTGVDRLASGPHVPLLVGCPRWRSSPVRRVLAGAARRRGSGDLDPPRSGAGREVVDLLAGGAPG